MPSASENRFRQSWKLEELSGTPAQAWLIVRRTVATLLAIGLLIFCGWLILRLFLVPTSYLAYWSASRYEPLRAGPVKYAFADYTAIESLKGSFAGSNLVVNPAEAKLTKNSLMANLSELANLRMRSKDACLVFITAHGIVRNDKPYLLCELGGTESVILVSEVLESLKQVPAGTKLLILDAARNELALEDSVDDDMFPALLDKEVKKNKDPSLWVLTANASLERSHVSAELKRPVFGYMVSQGLRGAADHNQNGEIGLDELYNYVQRGVAAWVKTATAEGETQTPQLYNSEMNSQNKVPALRLIKTPKNSAEPEHHVEPVEAAAHEEEEGERSHFAKEVSRWGKELKEQLSPKEELHLLSHILGHKHSEHGGHGGAGNAKDAHAGAAAGEHGDAKHEDTSHDSKAETKASLAESATKQVSAAWQQAAQLESSDDLPSPGVLGLQFWRPMLEKILWCDQVCASGVPADAKESWKQVLKELESVNRLLEGAPVNRSRTYLQVTATNSIAPEAPTLAMAMRLDLVVPDKRLPKPDFIDEYDGLLEEPAATFKDKLDKLLTKEKSDPGLATYYELQLLGLKKDPQHLALNKDPEISSELLQLVLRARRIGEKVAADPLCGEGWLRTAVDKADRLRSEGERQLLDRTSTDWDKQASDRLKAAASGYIVASRDLAFVGNTIQYRNQILLRAPDLVQRAILNGRDQEEMEAVKKVFAAVEDLNSKLADPAKIKVSELQGSRQRLENASAVLERTVDPTNNATRTDNLLATTLRPESRGDLRKELNKIDTHVSHFKVPESETPAVTSSAITEKQWKQVLGELSMQIALARLAGYSEKELKKLSQELEVKESEKSEKLSEKVEKARDDVAELFNKVPNAISEIIEESAPDKPAQLGRFRKVLPQWLLLNRRQRDQIKSKINLIAELDRAVWHDLLDWNSLRFQNATDDAPIAIQPFLRGASASFLDLAYAFLSGPAPPQSVPPTLSIEAKDDEVPLIMSDTATVGITVESHSNEEQPIWFTVQYNHEWLDVNVNANISHQHELSARVAEKNPGDEASRFPLRADKLGFTETEKLPAGGKRPYTIQIKRRPDKDAGGVTKLIVKAISGQTFVRRELNVVLPGRALLDVIVNSPTESGSRASLALRPLPNRVQDFTFDVKGEKVEKNITVSIWAPTTVSSEDEFAAIPRGAIDKDLADQVLEPFGLRQLGPEFPIKLSASGTPVRVKLSADDAKEKPPANLLLKGADPKTFPGILLEYGLLIRMADKQTDPLDDKQTNKVTIRRIKITPQRPNGYLEAVATYDHSTERLDIKVKATNPAVVPADGLKISANVFGASDQGENSLAGTLQGPSNEVKLFTELVPVKSLDTKTTVYINVDKYPRAFVFKIPRNVASPDTPILPETNLREVRIVSPGPGKAYAPDKDATAADATTIGPTTLKVKAEIDAPDGAFDYKEDTSAKVSPPKVEIGIDQKQQRTLEEGDPVVVRRSDRQVTVMAKSLSPDGTLELYADVGDFDVDLSTGLTNKRVTLVGRLVVDGKSTLSDEEHSVEVALDSAPPVVHVDFPPQPGIVPTKDLRAVPQVISGEDLLVRVFMSPEDDKFELSGVKTVQAAFVTEATKDSKPAKPQIGAEDGKGGWIVKLSTKDEKLGLGRKSVRITATDKVENESKPFFVPVDIVTKPGTEPANANNAKTPPLPNDVSGTVQFGNTGVPSKVELIAAAGPPIKPTDTDASGAFKFTKVPPGKYTLKVITTEALQNYKRKAEKVIDVPPSPQKFAPINIKVK